MKLAPIVFNNENFSGLMGSISIACWVIVFVPQIYENFYRSSAEGLSLLFIVLWLAGDVFNLVGAMMQHLLVTMIILAAYYTLADIILLIQCLWYNRSSSMDPILNITNTTTNVNNSTEYNHAHSSNNIDPIHFSPATPINENVLHDVFHEDQPLLIPSRRASHSNSYQSLDNQLHNNESINNQGNSNIYNNNNFNTNDNGIELEQSLDKGNYLNDIIIVSLVIFAGFISWYIPYCNNYYNKKNIYNATITYSNYIIKSKFSIFSLSQNNTNSDADTLLHINNANDIEVNILAQVFGYLSALLYLGSRIPQILLNFKRKSCEGISFLFFLFACLGNTTFITSVIAISLDPKYLLINASWLIGSSGTLIMDFIIFGQFFLYGRGKTEKTLETISGIEDA
ncbi:hypothetical protein RI543_002990 [Arxiozyma heterogenica]|uniref:Uncharacterized protein n=1 Tax=Arxiozyma heterogenica TaxID=278026 RepID=A0AAN7WGD8_9SACH|nr:hypothetical protein RI543_002990 [Kazachstania heterogenica]